MGVVQALYWMKDLLSDDEERAAMARKLQKVIAEDDKGSGIKEDLRKGFSALPIWMQPIIRELVGKNWSVDRVEGLPA